MIKYLTGSAVINLPHGYHTMFPRWFLILWFLMTVITLTLDVLTLLAKRRNRKLVKELEAAQREYDEAKALNTLLKELTKER